MNSIKELIYGTLLGDGCVFLDRGYARYKVTAKDKNFLKWLGSLYQKKGVKTYISYDKSNENFTMYSSTHSSYQIHRSNWYRTIYKKTQKILPLDLRLTPTVLLHWYLGDGCLTRARGNRIPRIVLATNCFSPNDLNVLQDKLATLDLHFYFVAKNRKKLVKTLETLGAILDARGEYQYQGLYLGFRFDILVADPWVGLPAIKRSKIMTFEKTKIRLATPEDLIVMKTVADRPIDRRDTVELRELFKNLDEKYIQKRLEIIKKICV